MKIIGVGHYSRTGKDSLANAILASLKETAPHLRVAKRPFAWKLKEIAHDLYAWAGLREPAYYDTPQGEIFRDIVLPAIGKTPVEIWCGVGNGLREQVHVGTWIDYLLKSDLGLDVVVVPDVRFPNEVEAVETEEDSILAKVVRPGYGPKNTKADRALLGYNGWNFIIGGSGRMDELHSWGARLAAYVAGTGSLPFQSDDDRRFCMSVEVLS
jgi:hypothetical protein